MQKKTFFKWAAIFCYIVTAVLNVFSEILMLYGVPKPFLAVAIITCSIGFLVCLGAALLCSKGRLARFFGGALILLAAGLSIYVIFFA